MPLLLKAVAFVQGLFMFSYQRNVKSNPEHDLISAACYVVLALEPTFSGQNSPSCSDFAFVYIVE